MKILNCWEFKKIYKVIFADKPESASSSAAAFPDISKLTGKAKKEAMAEQDSSGAISDMNREMVDFRNSLPKDNDDIGIRAFNLESHSGESKTEIQRIYEKASLRLFRREQKPGDVDTLDIHTLNGHDKRMKDFMTAQLAKIDTLVKEFGEKKQEIGNAFSASLDASTHGGIIDEAIKGGRSTIDEIFKIDDGKPATKDEISGARPKMKEAETRQKTIDASLAKLAILNTSLAQYKYKNLPFIQNTAGDVASMYSRAGSNSDSYNKLVVAANKYVSGQRAKASANREDAEASSFDSAAKVIRAARDAKKGITFEDAKQPEPKDTKPAAPDVVAGTPAPNQDGIPG